MRPLVRNPLHAQNWPPYHKNMVNSETTYCESTGVTTLCLFTRLHSREISISDQEHCEIPEDVRTKRGLRLYINWEVTQGYEFRDDLYAHYVIGDM